jgi:hypothetical protein
MSPYSASRYHTRHIYAGREDEEQILLFQQARSFLFIVKINIDTVPPHGPSSLLQF